jgi:hypothetical protein
MIAGGAGAVNPRLTKAQPLTDLLPNVGPKTMKDGARLLLAGDGPLEVVLLQHINYELDVGLKAVDDAPIGASWDISWGQLGYRHAMQAVAMKSKVG